MEKPFSVYYRASTYAGTPLICTLGPFYVWGCTPHIALGLGCGVAACAGVFACRALGVRGAGVVPRASARYDVLEESGRAQLALGLTNGGCADVLARRTRGVLDGGAGIGLGAAARRVGFEESKHAILTYRLGGAGAGYHGVLARRALAVRSATTIGTTWWSNVQPLILHIQYKEEACVYRALLAGLFLTSCLNLT